MEKMIAFIARSIEMAGDKGIEEGQAKYRAYFGRPAVQRLYGKYQEDVNAILEIDGYADCIVAE